MISRMELDAWIEQITEAFRERLVAILESYRVAGLDPLEILGPPEELGERAALAAWPGPPEADSP